MSVITFALFQISVILWISEAAPTRVLRSPCPEIFRYEKVTFEGHRDWVFPSKDHRWRGIVTVPPSLPIYLRVKLLTPAALPSKYVGRIELSEDKNQIVAKITRGSHQKIKYYVYFPAEVPVPELIFIEVNSRIICSQPIIPLRLKTILTLEHSLLPIKGNVTLRDGIGSIVNNKKTISDKGSRNLTSRSFTKCGKSILKTSSFSGKVSVSAGDWPWMVPLFKKTELGLQFLCSSTLVSFEYAVTAAHCMQTKNSGSLEKESVVAYAGRFDITNWTEEDVQPRELSQIFIHPEFNPNTLHSDLAVLKFSKPLEISSRVSPACIWDGEEDLDAVVNKKAIVFGWGADGLGHKVTPTPNLAVMPIVSQEECLRSKMEFLFLTSNRTLCAGFRNGTGPCSGDSGGGLLLPLKDQEGDLRWYLRGVVSLSLMQNSQIMCDVEDYTVFTDVAKYKSWILGLMEVRKH